mgnify:CR=1 FL=1
MEAVAVFGLVGLGYLITKLSNTTKEYFQSDVTQPQPQLTTPLFKAEQGNSVKGSAQEIDVAKRNVNKPGGNKGAQDWYNGKETSYESNKGAEGQTTDGKMSVDKKSLLTLQLKIL